MTDDGSYGSSFYELPPESTVELVREGDIRKIDKNKIKRVKFSFPQPKYRAKPQKPREPKLFSDGKEVTDDTIKDLDKEISPNYYPNPWEQFSHIVMTKSWRKIVKDKDLKVPVAEKKNCRQRLNDDLFNRLYVKTVPTTTQTVLDFDSSYFNMIAGRPFDEALSTRDYVKIIRDNLKTKIMMGYLEDDIMLLNQNLANEQITIHKIQKNYQKFVQIFEDILYKDHSSARESLKEADNITKQLYESNIEYKKQIKKYASMKAALYSSEERWNNCKMFQKFLFNLSPLHWKKMNKEAPDSDNNSIELGGQDEEEAMFGEYRTSMADKGANIDEMLEHIHKELSRSPSPKLYFTDPNQILEIYEYMETQNLNYLIHAEELALPLANMKNGMEVATMLFDFEIGNLNQSVKDLSSGIEWEERRARDLENMGVTLIHEEFKELIVSDPILNLYVYVEDTYESRIGPNDANLSILEMMRAIETKYRQELLNFDMVPHEIVASLEGSCFSEQQKIMKLAEKAAKQYAELDVMTKQLKRAFGKKFEPGHSKGTKQRSKLLVPPKPPPPPPRGFTQEEDDYLEHFTDFCKFTDDPKTYGVDITKPTSVGIPKFGTYVVQQEEPKAYTAMATATVKYVKNVPGIDAISRLMNVI